MSAVAFSISDRTAEAAKHTPRDLIGSQSSVCPVLHVVSPMPSQRPNNDVEREPMSWPRDARNAEDPRVGIRNGLHIALVKTIPQYRNPAKEVAERAQTSTATVRSLRQQNIPEAMVTLIMLARGYPEFRSEVRRLMGLDAELDPDFQRELAAFLRRVG